MSEDTITYEVCPSFGWGVIGMNRQAIRRILHDHGLTNNAPVRFSKMSELIIPCPVSVTGPRQSVESFKEAMKSHGYDDRST